MKGLEDITILYISASQLPEHWMQFQIATLLDAVGDTPIISMTRKPLDLGENYRDTEPMCYWNIYRQMYLAASHAKTPYVAQAEDDVLYSNEHFREYRPKDDEVAYNRSRWSLFSWDARFYCLRNRISNCTLVAPRLYLLDALKERLGKWKTDPGDNIVGEVGRPDIDAKLGVSPRNKVEWWSTTPVVQLNHPSGSDIRQKTKWKSHGQLKAFDIPHWGKSSELVKRYTQHP
jgi:hypothetical protein